MSRAGLAIAVATGLVLLVAGVVFASAGNVKMVEANNRYAFSPRTQFVNVGGSVTWTNTSDAPHTVTSDSAGVITSPTIKAGKTFSMTFNSTGSIPYHCTIHSYMHGTIRVLAAGATLPATDSEPLPASPSSDGGNPALGLVAIAFAGPAGFAIMMMRLRRRRSH
ncbi:MAG: plastocyanin/azurin family copper-binding protein [Chloroflexota bacterium]